MRRRPNRPPRALPAPALLLAALLLAACGGSEGPPPGWEPMPANPSKGGAPPPAPPPGGGPPGAPGGPGEPEKPLPKMDIKLTEADFIEGTDNRDPFRSFVTGAGGGSPERTTQLERKVFMPRYGLDELRLIAVVAGRSVRPRAMFRDPSGLGVTVKRGDFISKSGSKIKRILRDKVVVQIEEIVETRGEKSAQTTYTDRVIELHPKETQNEPLPELQDVPGAPSGTQQEAAAGSGGGEEEGG